MKVDKFVEAIVIANSTPQIQVDTYLNNVGNTESYSVEMAVTVFRMPKKDRTYKEMKDEMTQMFIKQLGLWELIMATLSGLKDKAGPIEGIQKSVIAKACLKMGYRNPVAM
jgi:hypothetical protein